MLTTLDVFLGFAGLVTMASLWNMFGGDMFPPEKDPSGGEYSRHLLTPWFLSWVTVMVNMVVLFPVIMDMDRFVSLVTTAD